MIGLYALLASLNGIAMLTMGAVGAHGLEPIDPVQATSYQIGWQVHGMHSVLLAVVAIYGRHNRWMHAAFWLGLIGTGLFCVPIYGAALGWWAAGSLLTPVGGFLLMAAWFGLGLAGIRRMRAPPRQVYDPEQMRRYYEATPLARLPEK